MPNSITIGRVTDLCRFPVKSMAGEHVEAAPLTADGILGDRAVAIFDVESGAVVSASNKHFPGLLDWRAAYLASPLPGAPLPPIQITTPDGESWMADDATLAEKLSDHFDRPLSLVRTRSAAYAAKQAGFFAEVGLEDLAPAGTLVDLCPLSVISTGTLQALARHTPESDFDARRFRMNIVVDGAGDGFVDNDWVGADLLIGDTVRLHVALPDPRCSMTTLPQGRLPKDPGILRTIVEANSRPVGTSRPLPCAGVYATVRVAGTVRRGDLVQLLPPV